MENKKHLGWEIIKMVSEGELQIGDKLKVIYQNKVVKEFSIGTPIIPDSIGIFSKNENSKEYDYELGSSMFTNTDILYEIVKNQQIQKIK